MRNEAGNCLGTFALTEKPPSDHNRAQRLLVGLVHGGAGAAGRQDFSGMRATMRMDVVNSSICSHGRR